MTPKTYLSILLLSILSISCDCVVVVKGKVLSASTGEPLTDVRIKMLDRKAEAISDENGFFEIYEVTGFCFDPKLELEKEGYKVFRMNIKSDSESVSYTVHHESTNKVLEEPKKLEHGTVFSQWEEEYSIDFKVKGDSIFFYLEEVTSN